MNQKDDKSKVGQIKLISRIDSKKVNYNLLSHLRKQWMMAEPQRSQTNDEPVRSHEVPGVQAPGSYRRHQADDVRINNYGLVQLNVAGAERVTVERPGHAGGSEDSWPRVVLGDSAICQNKNTRQFLESHQESLENIDLENISFVSSMSVAFHKKARSY
jgi:hypothetical protein